MIDKCEKPEEVGPCRGNFSRWSYDKDSMSCRQFNWGGCHGNENNFLTERECHLRCKDSGRSRGKSCSRAYSGSYASSSSSYSSSSAAAANAAAATAAFFMQRCAIG